MKYSYRLNTVLYIGKHNNVIRPIWKIAGPSWRTSLLSHCLIVQMSILLDLLPWRFFWFVLQTRILYALPPFQLKYDMSAGNQWPDDNGTLCIGTTVGCRRRN